jgi:uncharacterized membrane protein (DUF4010 family)
MLHPGGMAHRMLMLILHKVPTRNIEPLHMASAPWRRPGSHPGACNAADIDPARRRRIIGPRRRVEYVMYWNSSISFDQQDALVGLAVALAIGLLFGLERGWHGKQKQDSDRAAGVRTYGLIGLLGGVAGLLSTHLEPAIYGWMFFAVALISAVAYAITSYDSRGTGITSLIGGLLAFGLGTLATLDMILTAVASAVVATLLLGYKPQLHAWIERLELEELQATLKLLLITLVVLPLLPDRGFGPGEAVNPHELWWLVVLIAGISYLGYFAVKVAGPNKGIIITSLLAGLASSTALTLQLSKLAKGKSADTNLLGSGILIANATLVPRVLIIVGLISPALVRYLAVPLSAMTLIIAGPALYFWLRRGSADQKSGVRLGNPLSLGLAIRFGIFLTIVTLLTQLLADTFGEYGILALAALSGIADVNAITLSISRLHEDALGLRTAAAAILLAILTNALFKTAVCGFSGTIGLALRVGIPLIAATAIALALAWFGEPDRWLQLLAP